MNQWRKARKTVMETAYETIEINRSQKDVNDIIHTHSVYAITATI